MENTTLKGSLFGGFNRQNVIDYIAKLSSDANAQLADLQRELSAAEEAREEQLRQLTAQEQALTERERELGSTREQLQTLQEQNALLTRELERQRQLAQALSEELSSRKTQQAALEEELKQLRQQAEEYLSMKAHIAEIELSAHQRADALTEATRRETLRQFTQCHEQYRAAMETLRGSCKQAVDLMQNAERELTALPERFDQAEQALQELLSNEALHA
jgi:chromosome segregation ATPase